MAWLKTIVKVAKVGGKTISSAVKASTKLAGDVGKVVKDVGALLSKHPKLTAALAGYAAGKHGDDVLAYLKIRSIADDVIDALKKTEASLPSYTDELDKKVISAFATKPAYRGPKFANHPEWWFDPKDRVSYNDTTSQGIDPAAALSNLIHHNFWVDAGERKIVESIIPTYLENEIYDAYLAFYDRLALTAPLTKGQVTKDVGDIINKSWLAITNLVASKRRMDMRKLTFFGSKAAARVLMPVGFNDTVAMGHYDLGEATGVTFQATSNALTAFIRPQTQLNITDSVETELPLAWENVSNKLWNETVGRLNNLVLSDAAYNMAWYLYSGIFMDKSNEDHYEAYSFSPPPVASVANFNQMDDLIDYGEGTYYGALVSGDTTVSYQFQVAEQLISEVELLMSKDRVYRSLFAGLGLNEFAKLDSESKAAPLTWRTKYVDDFKRDPLSKTLRVYEADDTLYQSLVNARYHVSTEGSANEYTCNTIWDIHGMDTRKKYFFGNKKLTKVAQEGLNEVPRSINPIPSPIDGSAGEVASATKFCSGFMSLWVGPKIAVVREDLKRSTPYSYFSPYVDVVTGVYQSFTLPTVPTTFMQDYSANAIESRFLPLGMQGRYYTKATSTNHPWVYTSIAQQTGIFEEISDLTISSVIEYQWPNLFLPIRSLTPLIKQLNKLDLQFAAM